MEHTSDRLAWFSRRLDEVDGDIDNAREDSSHNALAALHREARIVRDQLDAERARLETEARDAEERPSLEDADEVIAAAVSEARELPLHDRRALVAELTAALLGAPELRVVGE